MAVPRSSVSTFFNWFIVVISETPSTMSPPHSMFISESVDGQAKPEPMDQGHAQRTQTTTKVSS